MTKEEKMKLQAIWDELLINAWVKDWNILSVAIRFTEKTKPGLVAENGDLKSFSDMNNYLVSLNLSRCLDRDFYGNLVFSARCPTRGFISARSEKLSNCLWNGKHKPEDILKAINSFKWKKIDREAKNEFAKQRRGHMKEINEIKRNIIIKSSDIPQRIEMRRAAWSEKKR